MEDKYFGKFATVHAVLSIMIGELSRAKREDRNFVADDSRIDAILGRLTEALQANRDLIRVCENMEKELVELRTSLPFSKWPKMLCKDGGWRVVCPNNMHTGDM